VVANVLEQRIGNEGAPAVLGAGDLHQPTRLPDRQRPQHHRVDQGEDDGVRANAERERQYGDDGESGIPTERSECVAQVPGHVFQASPAHILHRFFDLRDVAAFQERAPLGSVRSIPAAM
jgi:hypothetical protein